MKKSSIFLGLFILSMASNAADAPIKLNLSEVKIYLSGAELTHNAKIKLREGNNEIVLENIANKIEPNSINADLTGSATILDVFERTDYMRVGVVPDGLKALQDSLELYNRKVLQKNAELNALKAQEDVFMNNKALGGKDRALTTLELKQASQLFYESILAINNSRIQVNADLRKIEEKIEQIKRQVREFNAESNKPRDQIVLVVNSRTSQTVDLTLKYFVEDAGWEPFYDIRVKSGGSPLTFNRKANVRQNSGIDFNDIKLTLSTNEPAEFDEIPDINTVALGFADNRSSNFSIRGSRNLISKDMIGSAANIDFTEKTDTINDYATIDRISRASAATDSQLFEPQETNEEEYNSPFSEVYTTDVSAEFTTDLAYTIPSDDKAHLVELSPVEAPGTIEYYTAPKYKIESYRVAKLRDWENLNLLPGDANVYFENAFIGKTAFDPESDEEILTLPLGKDNNVVVIREILKDYTETKFLSSDVERTFAYKITIRNTKKEKIKITIEDQIPVSKNEDIQVKFIEGSGSQPDKDTGKITWVAEIEPGKSLEKTLKFSVKHPASKKVTSY